MDPQDEDQQCLNLEFFVAINYGRKVKEITEEKVIEKLKDCLCNGADVNAINHNDAGNTALHVAVRRHYSNVVQFLVENGANVNIENSEGLTALTLAQNLKCEQEIIYLLEDCAKSISCKLTINYRFKNQPIWSKLRNNSEIAVLEVNSVELSPDFLQQVEFYDAIDTAGNLFFVDVIVSGGQPINKNFIKNQLNRLNKQLVIQCGSVSKTRVFISSTEGHVNSVNLNRPFEILHLKTLTKKFCGEKDFGVDLLIKALKLNLVGTFKSERRSLLKVNFDFQKHFNGWKLIDCAIRHGDVLTLRLLSLSNWDLLKLNDLGKTPLSVAAEYGNVDKLGAVLRVKFPIQLNNNISIPKETAAHFDKSKKQMLHTAVRAGNGDVISFMAGCGAELDSDTIDLAWDMKRYNAVLYLLKADCVFPYDFDLKEVNKDEGTFEELKIFVEARDLLHLLIEEGNLDCVKEFMKSMPHSKLYLNKSNESALYKALKSQKLNIFVWLKSELKAEFRDEYERRSLGRGVLDSATDALVPHFVPIENAHVLHLVAKSRCHQHYAGFKEHIESIYTELNNISQISIIFKVIQFCDQVDIIYDFDKDSIVDVNVASSESDKGLCEYKAGRIYIGAKVDKQELMGTIAHELTHLAMQTIYDNDCKPYKSGDPMIDYFDEVIKEIRNQSIPLDSIIRRVFLCYGKDCWPSELIVRVNQMLATYGSDDGLRRLEVQAKSLLKYYQEHVTQCCETVVRESYLIKPRNIIKVLNDYAGIICRIDESKIRLKKSVNMRVVLSESEMQIAVVTSTSPLLSTMSVYQRLKKISQEANNFIIFNFDGYVKRRTDINQAFYSDVCKFLVLLCDSVPDKCTLRESVKKLAQVLWKKSDKKVVFIMGNSYLIQEVVDQLPNLSLRVCPDVEYTLDNLTIESAKLLLDQSVSLQCRDANIKLSSLIDEEHYKLVDAQTLLKLINKQPIVIGKQIGTSRSFDEHFYIDRSFSHQPVIKEEVLNDEDDFTMYAISEIDETTLVKLVKRKDLVCGYEYVDKCHAVKYVVLDRFDANQQYQQLCQRFPHHNIHHIKKFDIGFHWLDSRFMNDRSILLKMLVHDHLFYHYTEDQLADEENKRHVFVVSDSAGMGKSAVLTSLANRLTQRYPHLWVLRVNLNDYTKVLNEEQEIQNHETDQLSRALTFFVDGLLGSRVKSKLETEFERNLLLHFLQHNEERVVIMFDGFDEMKWSHQKLIMKLLVALKSSKVKQLWVTTRPHMRETLENTLHQLAYTLQPFNETDKRSFLMRFWRCSLGVEPEIASSCQLDLALEKLKSFAEALLELLSKSISGREKSFTGVPLQLKMVAECFEQNMKDFCLSDQTEPNLPQRLQLKVLYGMFFTTKYVIFQSEKNDLDFSKPNVEAQSSVQKESFLNNHRIASLFMNFDGRECEILLTSDELHSGLSFISEIADNRWNTGIIDLIAEGKPQFVNLTFAEYLTAEFIVNLLAKGEQSTERILLMFTKVIYKDNFKVVRAFIDSHLGEKCITDAVLNRNGRALRSLWSLKPKISQLGVSILELFQDNHVNRLFPYRLHICHALNMAAFEGNANLTGFLLKCFGSQNIRAKLLKSISCNKLQPLHSAAKHGHLDVVKVLVEHGADVNAQVLDKNSIYIGFNALLLAAYKGHANICEWLISNGADINAIVSRKESPFEGFNVLHLSASGGHLEVTKMFKIFDELNFQAVVSTNAQSFRMNALHISAFNNHWHVVKWIVSEGLIHLNSPIPCGYHRGESVVSLAIKTGPPEIVRWLIDHETFDFDNTRALHLAATRHNTEIVEMLVNRGANVNAVDRDGQTPLHVAAEWGSVVVLKFLLNIKDVDVNVVDKYNQTPLHVVALTKNLKMAQMLVNKGASVNAVNRYGHTPLHWAAQKGSEQVVESLLKLKDVDVNIADKDGNTPLHFAAFYNQSEVVSILVNSGANINVADCESNTPLFLAILSGSEVVVEFLLKVINVDVNLANNHGFTPLHIAARSGELRIVEMLVRSGANMSAVNSDGLTPLDIAAYFGKRQVVKFLTAFVQHH